MNGLVVGERDGLGLAQLRVPSLLREKGSVGLVSPLGLLVVGDRAAMIVPMEWIKSLSAWISGTDKALQAKATKYFSHIFPLVFRGVRGVSSSSPSC